MIRFNIFGIPVRVEVWFWITLALLGDDPKFSALNSNNPTVYLHVALFVLAGFVSILIHELGHALMIKKYKLPTEIVLTTMGGYATYPSGRLSRKQSFLVTLAGPAVQLIFGLLILFGIQQQFVMPSLAVGYFVSKLVVISIVWAVFNCVPIFPLDGGQMLAAVLGPRRAKGLYITGMVTAAILGLWALSVGSIFMTAFMGFFVYQNYQFYQRVS